MVCCRFYKVCLTVITFPSEEFTMNLRRVAAVTAACVVASTMPSTAVASQSCDQEIYYNWWWALQYECGAQHPQQGCYKEIGGPTWLAFDCTSNTPSMQCDAGGCYLTK